VRNNLETDFVTVDFDLPFPVHISGEPLDVNVRGTTCTLRFEKIARESIDPRLRLGGGDFAKSELKITYLIFRHTCSNKMTKCYLSP